jgi:hypothetical protein
MTMPPDFMYAILAMAARDEGGADGEPVGIQGVRDLERRVLNANGPRVSDHHPNPTTVR